MYRRALIVSMLAASVAVPSVAFACGNSIYLERSRVTRLLARAEQALEKGEAHRAQRLTSEVGRARWKRTPGLVRRFRLAKGMASIRTGSAVRGVPLLKKLKASDGPTVTSALAEGLSRLKGQHPEALRLLADLESRDLVPDAFGYAALVRLRTEVGDKQGALRAQARCEAMAPKREICESEPVAKKRKKNQSRRTAKVQVPQS